jgi:hypothetical protein
MAEVTPEHMRAVMAALDKSFNGDAKGAEKDIGIIVLTFPHGTAAGATTNYISNGASRAEVAVMLKEVAARLQGQPHVVGRA